jgi:G3E family GTPase
VEARLREIEPEAPILRAVRGDVDPQVLFPPETGTRDRSGPAPETPPHDHEHFETDELTVARGIAEGELRALLDRPELLRAKGFVLTAEGPRLLQLVGHRLELSPPDVDVPEAMLGRVVLIRRTSTP